MRYKRRVSKNSCRSGTRRRLVQAGQDLNRARQRLALEAGISSELVEDSCMESILVVGEAEVPVRPMPSNLFWKIEPLGRINTALGNIHF